MAVLINYGRHADILDFIRQSTMNHVWKLELCDTQQDEDKGNGQLVASAPGGNSP